MLAIRSVRSHPLENLLSAQELMLSAHYFEAFPSRARMGREWSRDNRQLACTVRPHDRESSSGSDSGERIVS
jgi:hypothetical protein